MTFDTVNSTACMFALHQLNPLSPSKCLFLSLSFSFSFLASASSCTWHLCFLFSSPSGSQMSKRKSMNGHMLERPGEKREGGRTFKWSHSLVMRACMLARGRGRPANRRHHLSGLPSPLSQEAEKEHERGNTKFYPFILSQLTQVTWKYLRLKRNRSDHWCACIRRSFLFFSPRLSHPVNFFFLPLES